MRRLGEEINPDLEIPVVVDCREVSKNVVETRPKRLGVETKLRRLGEEMKPDLEIPVVVDCRVVSKNVVDTNPKRLGDDTNPDVKIPVVVDTRESVETYASDPRPVNEDRSSGISISPAAVERSCCEEM